MLTVYGETFWAEWLTHCARELGDDGPSGLSHLLRAFGGMGSFSDLLIMAANGHAIEVAQEDLVNQQLTALRHQIWAEATSLQQQDR